MKTYPGKAMKDSPSIPIGQMFDTGMLPIKTYYQQSPYYQIWPHYTLPRHLPYHRGVPDILLEHFEDENVDPDMILEHLGHETVHMFPEIQDLPRQRNIFTSRLVSDEKPAKIYNHKRSISLDCSPAPVLSRRHILASLAQDESLSSSFSSLDSSQGEWTDGTSNVFSRSCLVQSISRDEDHTDRDVAKVHKYDLNKENRVLSEDSNKKLGNVQQEENIKDNLPSKKLSMKMLDWVATLGVGGFGRVELVTWQGEPYALKKIKRKEVKDVKQQQHILNEKKIMTSCSSPFVVQLYSTFHDSRYLYMLMEPCLGGELWTMLRNQKRFSDGTARFYVSCVILALIYLHSKFVIYRDLKPENILLDYRGYIKLTDFGFSRQLQEKEKAWTFCGTPEYVAPEVITNKSHDTQADIWALGILVFELLTGAPPFTKKSGSSSVYPEILKGMRTVIFPSYIASSASEIIRQCCRLQANQRPSLEILKRYMWFSGMDWDRLADRSLPPPIVPIISSSVDSSNFDHYLKDQEEPDEDFSDWADDF